MLSIFSCGLWPSLNLLGEMSVWIFHPFLKWVIWFFWYWTAWVACRLHCIEEKTEVQRGSGFSQGHTAGEVNPVPIHVHNGILLPDSSLLTRSYILSASPGKVTQSLKGRGNIFYFLMRGNSCGGGGKKGKKANFNLSFLPAFQAMYLFCS